MPKQSVGILLYRKKAGTIEVFLVHPGGPFYARKEEGVWSIPKGEFLDGEDPLLAAKREFMEETGQSVSGDFIELEPITQKGGKKVYAWAVEGDIDHEAIVSNTFEMQWPPGSGKFKTFVEVDRGGWFTVETAKSKIIQAQVSLIDQLIDCLQ